MEAKDKVLATMKEAGTPLNAGKIAELSGLDKKEVEKAMKLLKLVCTACGGSGGGKPDSAMGGGKDAGKVDDALALVDDFVQSKL